MHMREKGQEGKEGKQKQLNEQTGKQRISGSSNSVQINRNSGARIAEHLIYKQRQQPVSQKKQEKRQLMMLELRQDLRRLLVMQRLLKLRRLLVMQRLNKWNELLQKKALGDG